MRALPAAGFRGANVTIPHKERALLLADQATRQARAIGAANTLVFDERGAIDADNTDAPALIASLPFSAEGATALVLGAGGSARAAVWALLDAGARRSTGLEPHPGARPETGRRSSGLSRWTALGPPICSSTARRPDSTERAVFSRSIPLRADDTSRYRCVVDLVYTATETDLVQAARARSVAAVDGLELLVGQGALSFERFTGIAAPAATMRAAARRPGMTEQAPRLRAVEESFDEPDAPIDRRSSRRRSGAAGPADSSPTSSSISGSPTRRASSARSRRRRPAGCRRSG